MKNLFLQPSGSTSRTTNIIALARKFNLTDKEVIFVKTDATLTGIKGIYDKNTSTFWLLPSNVGTTLISFIPPLLKTNTGDHDLTDFNIKFENYHVMTQYSFDKGFTLNYGTQVVEFEGELYRWDGDLPKQVPAGSTPQSTGGIGKGAWVSVGDASFRSDVRNGDGSLIGVGSGTLKDTMYFVTPEQFGADGTIDGDTLAFEKLKSLALEKFIHIQLKRRYKLKTPLVIYFAQTHNKGLFISGSGFATGIDWHGGVVPYIVDVHGYNMKLIDFHVQDYSDVDYQTTAFRLCGENADIDGIGTKGDFKDSILSVALLKSNLLNLNILNDKDESTSKDHKGNGVRMIACVNTTVSNSVIRNVDYVVATNLYLQGETSNNLKPPSHAGNIDFGCEGITFDAVRNTLNKNGVYLGGLEINAINCVIDFSKNSWLTLNGQMFKLINNWFGSSGSNTNQQEMLAIAGAGCSDVMFLGNTFSGGRVDGRKLKFTYNQFQCAFTENIIENVDVTIRGHAFSSVKGNILNITTNEIKVTDIESGFIFESSKSAAMFTRGIRVGVTGLVTNSLLQARIGAGEKGIGVYTAAGEVIGTCQGGLSVTTANSGDQAVLYVGKVNSTDRSIVGRGTINTVGSDYAEYMGKAYLFDDSDLYILGIDANGMITDRYDDSIKFCLKSYNASFVGGDDWFDDTYPDINSENYEEELSEYNIRYEQSKNSVIRIAFCGQVKIPIKAKAGEYIFASRGKSGNIELSSGVVVDFNDYMRSIGQVISCNSGISKVIVKM